MISAANKVVDAARRGLSPPNESAAPRYETAEIPNSRYTFSNFSKTNEFTVELYDRKKSDDDVDVPLTWRKLLLVLRIRPLEV